MFLTRAIPLLNSSLETDLPQHSFKYNQIRCESVRSRAKYWLKWIKKYLEYLLTFLENWADHLNKPPIPPKAYRLVFSIENSFNLGKLPYHTFISCIALVEYAYVWICYYKITFYLHPSVAVTIHLLCTRKSKD